MLSRTIRFLVSLALALYTSPLLASVLDVFRDEDGHTNWQYVSNTSGSILILALTYTIVRLIRSKQKAARYNRQLEEIRSQLEERVRERTADLDESVKQLNESNRVLEAEIRERQATAEQLRLSEAYIADILRSMPLMLIGVDKESRITQWNQRAEEISGLPAEQVIGENLWQAYPGITVTPQQVNSALENGKTVTVKQSQRDQYHFDITLYPLEEASETGVVILIDDVTQQVSAESRLIQRDKMAAMGELAAAMASDLNSPLQALTKDIQVIEQTPAGTQPDPALFADMLSRSRQANRVVVNLLEFSHAGEGHKAPASIPAIIDASLASASEILSAPHGLLFSDIEIDRRYGTELPEVPCFEVELQQVFLSLLRHCCHALDAKQEDGFQAVITIEVSTFYDALWVKIQHNGEPISLEEQEYLFEPLTSETVVEGIDSGPGRRLSFPYFIISEQHRGQMAVTSNEESGTTFHIELLTS